jgi:hypothetical protein
MGGKVAGFTEMSFRDAVALCDADYGTGRQRLMELSTPHRPHRLNARSVGPQR